MFDGSGLLRGREKGRKRRDGESEGGGAGADWEESESRGKGKDEGKQSVKRGGKRRTSSFLTRLNIHF